jgi:prolyl 4-hydroxylase
MNTATDWIQEYSFCLTPEECQHLIEAATSKFAAPIVVGHSDPSPWRVADAMWIKKTDERFSFIHELLAELTGYPIENHEAIHVIRYNPGGHYKDHYDYFPLIDEVNKSHLLRGGQRVKTCIFYLNEAYAGGATYFPYLQRVVVPQTGKLIIWDNVIQGELNKESLHSGLPVVEGTKYIATVWIREGVFV